MRWSSVLQELAAANDGVFDRRQAAAAGVPPDVLEREVRAGRFVRPHPRVYRPVALPPTADLSLRAALLAAGLDAVVSHRAAAHRHGILPANADRVVEILVPRQRRPRLDGVIVHRSLSLPPGHVTRAARLPVTTVDRTLADLGAVTPAWVVAAAMEAAVIAGKTEIRRLYAFVDDHGKSGRAGVGALRAALDDWVLGDSRPASALEVMFTRLVARSGLPMPELQHPVRDGGRIVARVDAAWPEIRLVVEVDGAHAHATSTALQRDLERQNTLVTLGWTVLRFTWNDIVRRQSEVIAILQKQFAIRGSWVSGKR